MPEDNSYLSDRDKCFISEDRHFWSEIEAQNVTVFFRPDDRTESGSFCYVEETDEGESFIGRIDEYGDHAAKIPPVIGAEAPVKVVERFCVKIRDVLEEDLHAAYDEIENHGDLINYLKNKYPDRASEINLDFYITVHRVKYCVQKQIKH